MRASLLKALTSSFWCLPFLIASLGLNTNSTAVIIGAMLISPLMGPIIGLGLGIGVEDFELVKRSMRNLTVAAAFSVLASCLYFLLSPVSEGHSELLARTSPTIYDVFIGFSEVVRGFCDSVEEQRECDSGCCDSHGAYAAALHCRLWSCHMAAEYYFSERFICF